VQGIEPEKVHVSTIDAETDPLSVPDILVLKLDVEDNKIPVLDGARATLVAAPEAPLLMEDFVDDSVGCATSKRPAGYSMTSSRSTTASGAFTAAIVSRPDPACRSTPLLDALAVPA
jgi:hypothetical protein